MIGVVRKVGLFPGIANCHLIDVGLRVDDPLRELVAGSCTNLLVGVLCKDLIVELLTHLCFE